MASRMLVVAAVAALDLKSTASYEFPAVREGWYPPMWNVARPPRGREFLMPEDFVNLLEPSTWFIKQGKRDTDGVLKIALGGKLDWPVVLFNSIKAGQSLEAARATALEWAQSQPPSDRLNHVPVKACLQRMFGRNNALLDPLCKLVQVRQALYTLFGLMGYDLDNSCLRTPVIEIMRPVAEDLRDIKVRIMWRRARLAGAL